MEERSFAPSPRAGINRTAARVARGPADDATRAPVKAGAMLALAALVEVCASIVEHWAIAAVVVVLVVGAEIAGLRP